MNKHYPRRITTAIVPAAGLGSRMRPLSDAVPKELLPLGRRAALQHLVSELAEAGIRKIVFVTSPAKEAVLRGAFGGRDDTADVDFVYALQPTMRGLGDAILRAEHLVQSDEPVLLALGDAVITGPVAGGLTARLIESCAADARSVGLAVQRVPPEKISRYGIVEPSVPVGAFDGVSFAIKGIVEKPKAESAPSDFAAAARYVLPFDVFGVLQSVPPDAKGEVQLTDALRLLLASGHPGVAVPLAAGEMRHDIGGFDSYFRAFVQFALADPETGASFRRELQTILTENKESIVE